jgi:hypothetical protein
MKMSTNIQPNEGTGGDDECRPLKTDILLPGEDWVVDKWTVSSGSSVRAGETIAFVCKRSDTNHSDKTTTAAVVAATAQHKRPTRKKKGGGTAAATVVAAVVGNKDNQKPSSNTSSTEKSAVPSLKNLLAAKNRTESLAEIGRTESSPITSDEKKFLSDTAATSITSKTNQSIPIRAPVTGLLRIYNSSTGEHHQQKLFIGVIEEFASNLRRWDVCSLWDHQSIFEGKRK